MSQQRWGNILIVGGSGRLGYYIAETLQQQPECGSIYSVNRTKHILHPCEGVDYRQLDVLDSETLTQILQEIRPETIFNVAAPAHTSTVTPKRAFEEVFVNAQDRLIRRAQELGTKYMICTTSINVTRGHEHIKDREDSPYWPRDSTAFQYWVVRAEGERRLLEADGSKLQTLSIRLPLIIGERENAFVPFLLRSLKNGQTNAQIGPNTALMDVVSGNDAARAHILGLRELMKPGNICHGEAFNIIGKYPLPFWTMARVIWTEAGWRPQKEPWIIPAWLAWCVAFLSDLFMIPFGVEPQLSVHAWRFMCNSWTYDDAKAREHLGFVPLDDTVEELRKSVRWHLRKTDK